MNGEKFRGMRASSYKVYFTVDDNEVGLDFADLDAAIEKAEELQHEGFDVYLAYYDDDGDEVFYDSFDAIREEVNL